MFKLALPVVHWSDFLDQEMIELCRSTVRDNRDKFVPTTTSTNEVDFRSSVVLWHHNYLELKQRFEQRLTGVLPMIRETMQEYVLQTAPSQIEVQLTNHYRNGDKFRKHVDNASVAGQNTDTPKRRVTCVYYFNMQDENKFEGGDLFVYLSNGTMTIQPIHNSIAIFPSHVYHEVVPITSKTQEFMDGRFTLNSWIHG